MISQTLAQYRGIADSPTRVTRLSWPGTSESDIWRKVIDRRNGKKVPNDMKLLRRIHDSEAKPATLL
jgi:hypothetical protein